ncbi:MAG TPA: LemA family protein, partial [Candidatus Limnocylindrales bacterium]|nr:LemA family protein [Candidatus Limnocylindrales bacterium]
MDPVMIVVLVALALVVVWAVATYNGLVGRRLRIDEAWAQIEVQLKRRHDLIPNLVNAVRDYMGFEQDVLTRVTEARAA